MMRSTFRDIATGKCNRVDGDIAFYGTQHMLSPFVLWQIEQQLIQLLILDDDSRRNQNTGIKTRHFDRIPVSSQTSFQDPRETATNLLEYEQNPKVSS
jgi:hypothetical protein